LDPGWPGHKLPSGRMKSIQALCIAVVAGAAVAQEPRPSLEEHKAKKQAEKDDAAAEAAREAKMAGVNKVITMLEDLTSQVLAEGEKEAKTYNQFACFCKDGTKEKSASIETGEDDKSSLISTIQDLSEKRDEHDDTIETLQEDIEEAEKELKEATDERHATLAVFEKNNADLTGALEALDGAIEVLKSSKSSFLQLQNSAKDVRSAVMLADVLGLGHQSSAQQRQVVAFLQQPEVEMESYKFHSQSVVETLEDLKKDFRTELQSIDAAEVKSVAEFQAFKQEKLDHIKAKEKELDDTKALKDKTTKEIAMNTAELTTVAADLLDNQQYLKELAEMCESRAKTWDQRSKVRADELSALTAATAIVKSGVKENTSAASVRLAQQGVTVRMSQDVVNNEESMEAIEAEAEGSEALGFLQRRMEKTPSALISVLAKQHVSMDDSRQMIVNLFNTQGTKIKSTLLLDLANQIKADPFAKVKKLIQDLIERLLQEAADEANQKGWCDKAQSEAKQKREYAAEAIAELNGQMAELEAVGDKLTEELNTLETEIAEIESKQEENTKLRKEETAENEATVLEGKAGLEAVNEAIDILDKFYKTAAKEQVELVQKGPMDDAPDAGFDAGEAYTGAGGESGGILGMLDVIKGDFERTISATEKAEATAESEYQGFMTESSKSLVEKQMAEEQKSKQKDDAAEEYESADEDIAAQTALLKSGIKELIELKPTCVDTGMSYEERVARREDEIESLKKGLCVLQQQGPGGDGANC